MDDYTTISIPVKAAEAFRNLTDLITFYSKREQRLAEICLKHMTQTALAKELGLTKQAINIRYSKTKEVTK